MGLNIKNREVERLVDEVARLTGETKTEAVRRSLEERRGRLSYHGAAQDGAARLTRFLETEVWPLVPDGELGRKRTKGEEEEILGYGRHGA